MYKKVLVTLDGSRLSEAVLPHLEKLLEGCPADVTLLAVAHPPRATRQSCPSSPFVIPYGMTEADVVEQPQPVYAETKGQAIQRAEHQFLEYLQRVSGPLRDTGSQVRAVVRLGEPKHEIIDFARQGGYDFVLMATHGRSGLSELVQGSVAGAVVKSGVAPALLVRPETRQDGGNQGGSPEAVACPDSETR